MLPIKYPDHFPNIEQLTGRAHNLKLPLYNPSPKMDWKPGDIAWLYDQKEQAIMAGIIASIRPENDYAFVRDIYPSCSVTECGAWCKELFPTSDSLYKALFFGTVPNDGEGE